MVKPIEIGDRKIGPGQPCFIIAEAGVNHNGDIRLALELVEAAKDAGADAIKFQLFRVEEQISGSAPTAEYQKEHTGSANMTEMAKTYDLAWDAHYQILDHCHLNDIQYMASCFDTQAVDFYIGLGGQAIKVGSGELTNHPLLDYMSGKGIPILLSTGMSTLGEIEDAVSCIREAGNSPLALFHCVSNYPTVPESANLRAIQTLERTFSVPTGFSDHTLGSSTAIAAVALGACMLEKHFTLDKQLPGPDHAMSMSLKELKNYIDLVRQTEASLGDGRKELQPGESEVQKVARRSVVSTRLIRAGEAIDASNTALKRPATGIEPRFRASLFGRIAADNIPADMPISWDMLV